MNRPDGLYVALLSVHGLIRGHDLELGRDADTGGQVTYVVELARALARHPSVGRVDLFTRRIADRRVSDDYARDEEDLGGGARIIRIPCGPKRYLRKERLWPYLHGFVDNSLQHFRRLRRLPDIVHGHYADAGYVGAQIASLLGVPFVFTGHSLGRVKRERLLDKGSREDRIDKQYNFAARIEAEEFALDTAALVVASTRQEVRTQYALYDHYQPQRMRVIPPGVDLERFHPPSGGADAACAFRGELERFLQDPDKPMILAMARPDDRKNFPMLVKAYAENEALRDAANLVLILGCREDIQQMDRGARVVLGNLFYLIDLYDLYGRVAFPKQHEAEDVPDIYRLAAASGGVFVNPALTEPFGLTLIEAAASGLPIVATNDGGPQDIVDTCENGVLIDPLKPEALGRTLLELLNDTKRRAVFAKNGIERSKKHYSWAHHVDCYLGGVQSALDAAVNTPHVLPSKRSRLPTIDRVIVTDVDNTLTGDDEAARAFFEALERAGDYTAFGIATGRNKKSALQGLRDLGAPMPDILITSAGADIHYGDKFTPDRAWHKHIDYHWYPDSVRHAVEQLPGIYPQEEEHQRPHKLSYTVDTEHAPAIRRIRGYLRECGLRVKVIFSLGMYLDLMPIRASAGLAIRYLAFKWGLSPDHLLVAGDSGNDEEMLTGHTLGVVVGNFSPELAKLRGRPRIYFAEGAHAWGILEGIEYYRFFDEIRIPSEEEESTHD